MIVLVILEAPGTASHPESPSTQYSRFLFPKPIPTMVSGTRDPKYWVVGPSGSGRENLNVHRLRLARLPQSC